jgi:hypothetical protein
MIRVRKPRQLDNKLRILGRPGFVGHAGFEHPNGIGASRLAVDPVCPYRGVKGDVVVPCFVPG